MRVAIYVRQPAPPHEAVAAAVLAGVQHSGEMAWTFGKGDRMRQEDADVVFVFGIGGDAKDIWNANSHARRILLDKPYARALKPHPTRYYLLRVAVDAFQPIRYFQKYHHTPYRWRELGIEVKPYRVRSDGYVLFDGASNKYCLWNDLPPWPEWGQQIVHEIARHTPSPIIYRPRPSHNEMPKVFGAIRSEGPLDEDFARSRVVVSHGGNIGFDAVVAGLPHFAIADSIARPLSETDWSRVGVPYVPSEERRMQWLHDLAYCQWNLDEFADGTAWRYVRETLELVEKLKHVENKYPEKIG